MTFSDKQVILVALSNLEADLKINNIHEFHGALEDKMQRITGSPLLTTWLKGIDRVQDLIIAIP